MSGKSASPEQICEVVASREAGFTVAAIATRTGLSQSTVQRILKRNSVAKGAAHSQLVEQAREQLLSLLKSPDAIAAEASQMIADDLAQAKLLRAKMLEAAEKMEARNLTEAALLMRAAAAMSTALKNTSDMVRQSLQYNARRADLASEDLPVLQVQELSTDQIATLRAHDGETSAHEIREPASVLTDSCMGPMP